MRGGAGGLEEFGAPNEEGQHMEYSQCIARSKPLSVLYRRRRVLNSVRRCRYGGRYECFRWRLGRALGLGRNLFRRVPYLPSRYLIMSFTESAVCDDLSPGQYQLLVAENTMPHETADSAILEISVAVAKQCR